MCVLTVGRLETMNGRRDESSYNIVLTGERLAAMNGREIKNHTYRYVDRRKAGNHKRKEDEQSYIL